MDGSQMPHSHEGVQGQADGVQSGVTDKRAVLVSENTQGFVDVSSLPTMSWGAAVACGS